MSFPECVFPSALENLQEPARNARAAAYRLLVIGLGTLAFCGSAHALRPFQGTDAAVAEPGTFELEAGVAQVRDPHQREMSVPELVGNWGIGHDTEIVLEGKVTDQRVSASLEHDTSLTDTALSVKHVWRPGTLQDASGISLATECGVLLPEWNASSGTGVSCAGIASNRWEAVEVHLNAGISRTREHTTAREFTVIAEAPEGWRYRPVFEAASSRDTSGVWSRSVLVGLIYRVDDNLALDVGLRKGHASEGSFDEVRAGLTWSVGGAK